MRYLWIFLLLLSGCNHNNHIDIANYHSVPLPLSVNTPSKKDLFNQKSMRVVVLNIDHEVNQFAKEVNMGNALATELISRLVAFNRIQVIERLDRPTFLNEQKMYELVKEHGVALENANYLLTGKISQASQKHRYHPSERDGSHAWSAYGACVVGYIKLFKLPSMQIQEVFPFDECLYKRQNVVNPRAMKKDSPELLRATAPMVIESIMKKVIKSFKPKGYIESMRINGDKKIIKTTLNRTLGAVEGREIEIVKIEKEKNLRGEEDVIEIPIGRGIISDIITENYSFIIVDELTSDIHRGDMVRVLE